MSSGVKDEKPLALRVWSLNGGVIRIQLTRLADFADGDAIHGAIHAFTKALAGSRAPSDAALVEAPFRLHDRVQRKGQFGDATGSIMAMHRFEHGWECWVHVAAYGSNSIIQADDLRFISHAPAALAAAKGQQP